MCYWEENISKQLEIPYLGFCCQYPLINYPATDIVADDFSQFSTQMERKIQKILAQGIREENKSVDVSAFVKKKTQFWVSDFKDIHEENARSLCQTSHWDFSLETRGLEHYPWIFLWNWVLPLAVVKETNRLRNDPWIKNYCGWSWNWEILTVLNWDWFGEQTKTSDMNSRYHWYHNLKNEKYTFANFKVASI